LKSNVKTSKFLICLNIILISADTIIIFFLKGKEQRNKKEENNKDDNNSREEEEIPFDGPFKVLLNDKDFIKPKIQFSAQFELIKTKNGMKCLLVIYFLRLPIFNSKLKMDVLLIQ
jgi:hypothetical protein